MSFLYQICVNSLELHLWMWYLVIWNGLWSIFLYLHEWLMASPNFLNIEGWYSTRSPHVLEITFVKEEALQCYHKSLWKHKQLSVSLLTSFFWLISTFLLITQTIAFPNDTAKFSLCISSVLLCSYCMVLSILDPGWNPFA